MTPPSTMSFSQSRSAEKESNKEMMVGTACGAREACPPELAVPFDAILALAT